MKQVNKYPLYEKDQVLSAAHLNQTTFYLEHQQLLTRRKLIGTGIVCGLNHSLAKNSIQISAGHGVTSEGYLIDFPEDKTYTKIKDYKLPDNAVYPPFTNALGKQVPLWELALADENKGKNLKKIQDSSDKFWRDKVVLLFLEIEDEDLKNCIEGDCDDKGSVRNFNVKPLLIGVADLVKFFNRDGDTIEDINSAVLARYAIKEIICPRFDVVANNLTTHDQIAESFRDNVNILTSPIGKALALMQALYGQKLGVANSLTTAWAEAKKGVDKNKEGAESVQQAYDYLCDLAAAINEFTNQATEWMVACHQDRDLFPQHLALGELKSLGKEIPHIFRNYFVYAPSTPLAHEKEEKIKFYYQRIWGMLTHFNLGEVDEIKVVASKYGEVQLSQKAIPFYFESSEKENWNWLKNWNYNRRNYGRWTANRHYFEYPENFLDGDIEPFSFFRIEGHVGKNYRAALADVQRHINKYRLPIKVLTLSTGGVPLNANPIPDSKFQDLEAMFDVAKTELFCALQTPLCFISSLDLFGSDQKVGVNYEKTGAPRASFMKEFTEANANVYSYRKSASDDFGRLSYAIEGVVASYTKGQFLSAKCKATQGTIGGMYLELIKNEPYRSQRLLELVKNRSGLSGSVSKKLLTYMLITIDEIEELVGLIKPATLSQFKFVELKEFIVGFTYFIEVFIKFIADLQKNPDVDTPPFLDELAVWLKTLKSICTLKKIVAIINERRERTLQILENWKFENFSKKHPGLTHKAGTTKGGTFIMVFHSETKNEEFEPFTLDPVRLNLFVNRGMVLSSGFTRLKMAEAYSAAAQEECSKDFEANFYAYAKSRGATINQANLSRFRDLLLDVSEKGNVKTPAKDGVILFDFFLPYICCGDGGVEIIMPEPKVSMGLDKREFCKNDKENYAFALSPEGGQVTGIGVFEEEGTFFFNPSDDEVKAGQITFSYVVQGRSTSLTVVVEELPVADFDYKLDSSPNGTFVSFENKSNNATSYFWEFGDEKGGTSVEENPTYFYSANMQETKVILTAKGRVCDADVKTEIIQLFEEKYELDMGKYLEFCQNRDEQLKVTINIVGRGEETFPFKGDLQGKGISKPTATNPFYTFNPSKAGNGIHKITYEIGGKEVASLNLTVKEPFKVSFTAKVTDANNKQLFIAISDIMPKNASFYRWYVNPQKPTEFVQMNKSNDFTLMVIRDNIKGMKTFPVKVLVNISPCVVEEIVQVENPDGRTDGGTNTVVNYFEPKLGLARYVKNATAINTINSNKKAQKILGTSLKTVDAATKAVVGVARILANAATKTKLISGKQNAQVAKVFSKALTDLNKAIPVVPNAKTKNRSTIIAEVYAKTYLSMVDLIYMQGKDLSKNSSLYKTYAETNNQTERIAKTAMATKVKKEVKAVNTKAADVVSKPNISGLAKALKTKL